MKADEFVETKRCLANNGLTDGNDLLDALTVIERQREALKKIERISRLGTTADKISCESLDMEV